MNKLRPFANPVKRTAVLLVLDIETEKISLPRLALLKAFLNAFETKYFIVYRGLPYCLLPDATDHIIQGKQEDKPFAFKDKKCASCLFHKGCTGWPEDLPLEKDSVAAINDAPQEVIFEITDKCDLKCLACDKKKGKKDLFLDFGAFTQILNECDRLEIKFIRFTGGEPLLHPRLMDMLNQAKTKGFYVSLNTNAVSLKRSFLRKLENAVDNILVSMQGHDQLSNSFLTESKESFFKKIENIRMINASKIPRVQVGTIISKTLLKHFEDYLALIKNLGVKQWLLFRPMTGFKNREYHIERGQFLRLMRRIDKGQKDEIIIKIANPVPFCISENFDLPLRILSGGQADDGHSRIVFDAGGFFKPSYFIDLNLSTSVRQAWNHRFMKKIRSLEYLPGECHACLFKKWCRGGSRYLSSVSGGSYFAKDCLSSYPYNRESWGRGTFF